MVEPRTITVECLTRVEGEGALDIEMRGDAVEAVRLRIYEPPRFFERILRGRPYTQAPDVTSRICGICPVAYQMTACEAMEDALGVAVSPEVAALRRLFYAGEWIESHALHVFLLQAPDLLGYPSGIAMAKDHGPLVKKGLAIKKIGNAIVTAVGGREIHPINARVGGFYRAPARADLERLLPALEEAQRDAGESLRFLAGLAFPELERPYEMVALRGGRIVSNRGLDLDVHDYLDCFEEHAVPHSSALHSRIRARGHYLVGSLARMNLCFDLLGPAARRTAEAIGFRPPCANPAKSLIARGLETIDAIERSIALIRAYVPPSPAWTEAPPRAATGDAATEAPRGLLYHRYTLDGAGLIERATIVPPTSQNQATIEDDLRALAPSLAALPLDEARRRAEQAVRSYDPCISCATHFLTLKVERR